MSDTANTISSSGLILTPSVSSSKNLSNPALAAGIGPELSFFFLLIGVYLFWISATIIAMVFGIINVAP